MQSARVLLRLGPQRRGAGDPWGTEKKKLRALVVEDSEDDAKLLVRELTRGGFDLEHERVETRPDMAAALARTTWDIVLSDFSMPTLTALQVLEVLHESGIDIPFISSVQAISRDSSSRSAASRCSSRACSISPSS